MDWHELSANWEHLVSRLQRRFPRLDRTSLSEPPRDSRELTHHIAEMHELTVTEARDALQDFLEIEGLARRATVLAGD